MDRASVELITKLEKQMAAMIDRYNRVESRLEKLGFDVAFIHAWINESRAQDEPGLPVNK